MEDVPNVVTTHGIPDLIPLFVKNDRLNPWVGIAYFAQECSFACVCLSDNKDAELVALPSDLFRCEDNTAIECLRLFRT